MPFRSKLFYIVYTPSCFVFQLYYIDTFNREVPFIMMLVSERRRISTFEGTVWIAKDDKTSKPMLINNKRSFTTFKNDPYNRKELIISAPGIVVSHLYCVNL